MRVDFTDDAGNEESLTSAATAEVAAAGLQLRSATLDGATLTLTYNEILDSVSLPVTAFTVSVNGGSRSVSAVSVSGSAVTLTLASEAGAGDAVTVDYTRPEGRYFIRDTRGRTADSFSGRVVSNDTAAEEQSTSRSQAPGSPRNLAVVRHESGKLRASWDAPDSGTTPTGYTVQWKESGDDWAEQADVSEAQVTGTSHVITGLTDGVEYAVRIITSTDDADSAPSGEARRHAPGDGTAGTLGGNRGRDDIDYYVQRGVDRDTGSCSGGLHGQRGEQSARGELRGHFGKYGDPDPGFRRYIFGPGVRELYGSNRYSSSPPEGPGGQPGGVIRWPGGDQQHRCCPDAADGQHPQRTSFPRWTGGIHLRTPVQREPGGVQLQDPAGPRVHGDWGRGAGNASPGQWQQHQVGDHRQAVLRR